MNMRSDLHIIGNVKLAPATVRLRSLPTLTFGRTLVQGVLNPTWGAA